jgi:hypothetical protein
MKESKSLDRFKKQAQEMNKMIEGKSDEEIERLVSITNSSTHVYAIFIHIANSYNLVLENFEAQCPSLRCRCFRILI